MNGRRVLFLTLTAVFLTFTAVCKGTDRLVPSEYATIQAAINAAFDSDIVIVSDGTYTGAGNKNLDFAGKSITVRSQNGPANCIIDCQNSGRCFYFHSGEDADSIVSGFTIRNGNVTAFTAYGGAIYCVGSSPVIENCIITANGAYGYNGSSDCHAYGGAISCTSAGNATIRGCTITSNKAQGGRGMDAFQYPTGECDGPGSGGHAYGGGIYASADCHLIIEDCEIIDNQACGGQMGIPFPCMSGNPHDGSGYGGGVYGYITISNSILSDNIATCGNTLESGYAYGGAIYCLSDSIIQNCLITYNAIGLGLSGSNGGAVYCNNTIIKNSTFYNNQRADYGNGGIYAAGSTTITDCILWNNEGNDISGAGYTVTYSCVEQAVSGTGNISSNPAFAEGPLGDCYLGQTLAGQAADSPCIDAGSDTAANVGLNDCTTRTDEFRDKGTVDMGYHYDISLQTADAAPDLYVDFVDYTVLAMNWLQCDSLHWLGGDIDRSECVDTIDLSLLAESWLNCYVNSAHTPIPSNNTAGVSLNPILVWTAGDGTLHHDVYFGTSFAAVNAADTFSPVYHGRQDDTIWDSGSLAFSTAYYWRIDEVGQACVTKGNIWNFTTWAQFEAGLDLISWWKLDDASGTMASDSADSNPGTVYGGAAWTSGKIDGALNFDGVDDYVDAGDKDNLDFGATSSFTITGWIKTSAPEVQIVLKRYVNMGNGVFAEGYDLKTYDSRLNFSIGDKNGRRSSISGNTVAADNEWHHVATVRDVSSDKLYLYLDGQLDAVPVTDATTGTLANIRGFWIGNVPYYNLYFNGIIDDVRVYGRALSAADVQQLYEAGLP